MSRKPYWVVLLYLLLPITVMAADYTYEACNSIDSKQLLTQLEQKIEESLKGNQPKPEEIEMFISQKWREMNFESVIISETDKAIATIKKNTGYWTRYGSSWGTDAANQFANQVSSSVFQSEAFNTKLVQLTEAYLQKNQGNLDKGIQQANENAAACIQAFTEAKYGKSVATYFNQQANNSKSLKEINPMANKDFGGGSSHITAGTGAAIALVGKQLVKTLAQKVAQRVSAGVAGRIMGSVASKFVPLIGWAMAAADFVVNADGALPDIASTIKSEETQINIQSELKNAYQNDLVDKSTSRKIADSFYSEWQKFKERYQQVMLLADNSPEFKTTLNEISVKNLEKFTNITSSLLRTFGQVETIKLASSGDIRKLSNMPESSLEILRFSKTLDVVFKWWELVNQQDTRLNKLVELEIFKFKQPQDMTSLQLNQLLLLNNKKVITVMYQLNAQDFETLLSAPQENLDSLAQQLHNQQDWEMVAWYIRHLGDDMEVQRYFLTILTKYEDSISLFHSKDAKREINEASNQQMKIRAIKRIAGVGSWWEAFIPSFMNPNWIAFGLGLIMLLVFVKFFNLLGFIKKLFRKDKLPPIQGY